MPSASRVQHELARIQTFFPALTALGNRFAAERPFDGLTLGLNMHLTTLTAALVRELQLGGGRFVVAAANPATTDGGVVEYLRDIGVEVHPGTGRSDAQSPVIAAAPDLVGDVGFALGEAMIAAGTRPKHGLVEITGTGVARLRAREPLPFPVLNINDGRLKKAIENRHGVGEGLWSAYTTLTGQHLGGRRVRVIGYGRVGAGVAGYAKAGGAVVEVVDTDPVRRLIARFDGHVPIDPGAVTRPQVVVTASGTRHALSVADIGKLPDDTVLINAGHHPDEIDVPGLAAEATEVDHIGPRVVRYRHPKGGHVVVLGGGSPLNIVMNAGSNEPVLLHFTLLALGMRWLLQAERPNGENKLPAVLEQEVARLWLPGA
ncbi:MAG: hypothetical protein EXR69_13215 [Myxococcales bacterium]|nr:hypothetical protein [Myxococcales bacterium]